MFKLNNDYSNFTIKNITCTLVPLMERRCMSINKAYKRLYNKKELLIWENKQKEKQTYFDDKTKKSIRNNKNKIKKIEKRMDRYREDYPEFFI